jgi:arylsulfatase A-like enzyme
MFNWRRIKAVLIGAALGAVGVGYASSPAQAQPAQGRKPNIITIISDDFGYGDAGCYGGGAGRGMPTPNLDRMAKEGMQFMSFYGQPSCTPGRAAMLSGRVPNRSGMTSVEFQGQGGGLPKAEWTTAAVLKTAGYKTFFTGKWHLGEADYALPNAHGFDEMKYCGIYHLNAYTYGDPTWFPSMPTELRAMFNKVTKGMMSGNSGQAAREEFKLNGQYVDKPGKPITMDGVEYPTGVVGIPYVDAYIEKAALDYLDRNGKSAEPIFMSINFMKVHQPNMPHPDYKHKSMSKSKYADSIVENDARIGHIMDKLRELGMDDGNTLVFWTTDNGAWQDVYPDAGYTPFRGTKGTDREGGNRVPAIAWMPRKIKADQKSNDIVGGLDFMATFAAMAGTKLPEKDLEGQPTMFDSIDMAPVLFGTGKDARETWSYFTENELMPGALRYHNYKFQFNLRGDNGAHTGGLAVDSNLGWKGPESYIATVPQIFDLWADPQERYDLFMNNFTETTWMAPIMGQELEKIGKTFAKYPPRKLQSVGYDGPITISAYEKFEGIKKQLEKQNINIGTGN